MRPHFIFFLFLLQLFLSFAFDHDRQLHPHHHHHEGCDHSHEHHHHHDVSKPSHPKLPEELAEEEDMLLYGFPNHHHHNHEHSYDFNQKLSGLGLWSHALGCSFLVSLASLICLILLPLIFTRGKPSKAVVDALALFGAGAMLGDAFLHQLPHAFGGEHSHAHDHHSHEALPSHSHSLKDLSVGLSILAGIVLFLLVEKVVRFVEENSSGEMSHGHHHHHHKNSKKLKDGEIKEKQESQTAKFSGRDLLSKKKGGKASAGTSDGSLNGNNSIRKRKNVPDDSGNGLNTVAAGGSSALVKSLNESESVQSPSNLVFGYLNLFSDGVHNFTDGMALGSAFLLYGSVGGWSRTLFLLAHELPQEIGDFGILVRSGFSVSKALIFNFLSALVALAGTAMALLWGQDPGQSSLIEGFTAGGFIYIAVAGVLAEMNNGKTYLKNTLVQVTSLVMGMVVALCISLVE